MTQLLQFTSQSIKYVLELYSAREDLRLTQASAGYPASAAGLGRHSRPLAERGPGTLRNRGLLNI